MSKLKCNCLILFLSTFLSSQRAEWPAVHNVVWNTPSQNSSESMPCGGGQIGLNVWVENDDILFYIGQVGSINENDILHKPGRVKIKTYPNLFSAPYLILLKHCNLKMGVF